MQQNRLLCLEEQDRTCETKLGASQTAHEEERRINQQTMFCPNVACKFEPFTCYQTHTRTEHEITWRRRGLVVSAGAGVVEKVTYQREHIGTGGCSSICIQHIGTGGCSSICIQLS